MFCVHVVRNRNTSVLSEIEYWLSSDPALHLIEHLTLCKNKPVNSMVYLASNLLLISL
jgi:hypothetical protein